MFVLGYSGFTRNLSAGKGNRKPFAKTHQNFNNIFEFREGEVPFSLFPLGYFGHDASAALLKDGEIIACASEERFTRIKFSLNLVGNTLLPNNAINYCLKAAGITINDIDVVAHYCNFTKEIIEERVNLLRPFVNKDTLEQVRLSYNQIYEEMMSKEIVMNQFAEMMGAYPKNFIPVRHHLAHSASAYFPSGLNPALIFTIDGTGELESSMLAIGKDGDINELQSFYLPTSLGALYLIITMYLGFKSLGDEYKVMGLASYGNPARYRKVFRQLITLESDGTYSSDLLTHPELKEFLLKNLGPAREPGEVFNSHHADVAASLQEVIHNAVLHALKYAKEKTELNNLCMAGGVALNCTLNGVIAKSGLFNNIFIQPAASDEGCSAGAAYYAYTQLNGNNKTTMPWHHAYLGPEFDDSTILDLLNLYSDSIRWKKEENIAAKVALRLASGKVVGWFQGRMEFGPRALGNRSILASPLNADMKDLINSKVKHREAFRPFAPAVLEEEAGNYFDLCGMRNSPYMLFAFNVYPEKRYVIPAVTHVDGSARVQTVSKKINPKFWNLINEFYKITGVPVILNTSFNDKNEPIVCTPKDAILCFLSTGIDYLAIGDYLVKKN